MNLAPSVYLVFKNFVNFTEMYETKIRGARLLQILNLNANLEKKDSEISNLVSLISTYFC